MAIIWISLLLLLIVVLAVSGMLGDSVLLRITAYFLLPLLAIALILPVARKRLPGLEMRANQTVVGTLFALLIVFVTIASHLLLEHPALDQSVRAVADPLLTIAGYLLFAFSYGRFRAWVLRRLLRIPLPGDELIHHLVSSIATSLDEKRLADLCATQLMPSLMIRQGALLYMDENETIRPLTFHGLSADDLPSAAELKSLLQESGCYRPIPTEGQALPAP